VEKNKHTAGGNIINIPNMKNKVEFPQKLKIELLGLGGGVAQGQSTCDWYAKAARS